MRSTPRNLWRRRHLLRILVVSNLKRQNKNTALGYLWWLLDPLLMTAIYYMLVAVLFRRQAEGMPYLLFLVVGLFAWKALADSLSQSVLMLRNQAPLLRSIGFPKAVLPISLVLSNAFYFLVALAVPFLLSFLYAPEWGCWPRWTWLLVPVALMLQIIFVAGLALVVSVLGVYFQDTANITGHLLHMWMFFSPVLYTMDQVPEHLRPYFQLNPMAFLLPIYRDLMIAGRLPNWGQMLAFSLAALAVGISGYLIFLRHEGRLVQRL